MTIDSDVRPDAADASPAPDVWPGLDATLAEADPEVAEQIAKELHRQQSTLEMIASENFAPVAALQAQGSVLTNKYAEGYPGAATTAAASSSTSSRRWPSSGSRRCSVPASPTSSRTPVRRRTPPRCRR